MNRILLYGATGYSGTLIANEAARRLHSKQWRGEFILASRDAGVLQELAGNLDLPCLPFALDDREPVLRVLKKFDVLINAAGPFTRTASRLAKAALDAGCHYVDLNSEPDVYQSLDDLAPIASRRALAMVCSAGWTTTASDVLLDHALTTLGEQALYPSLRTLRIVMSRCRFLSRGSAITMARAVREQVAVVRDCELTHVPTGQLERSFDLAISANTKHPCIASVCNVPDTLTAQRTVARRRFDIPDIESYAEMSGAVRAVHDFGSLGALALHLPFAQRFVATQFSLLPEGPRADERKALRTAVALEIENAWRETVASWVLETTNYYDFSACSALDVAIELAATGQRLPVELQGWLTPSAVLSRGEHRPLAAEPFASPFRGSVLYDRLNHVVKGSPDG